MHSNVGTRGASNDVEPETCVGFETNVVTRHEEGIVCQTLGSLK